MDRDRYKAKVMNAVKERQLTSIMNKTKWKELQTAVLKILPFPPPFQAKYVLVESTSPNEFEEDVWYVGDWVEGLMPFYDVEWIRVRPRRIVNIGRLISPEVIDITEEFIGILKEYSIPYHCSSDSIYIYGYTAQTDK
ncbi:hypothetical protein H8B09_29780 [Paenibacillus sp. PR3]|uniref:Uncharacterized protein n=1 Tax=Paenibacillus terricola TaxID=2763503 RepID=A0ABR8N6W9_9BACL|nr:DUF6678 family protein [Paenibacillus terricola]MBD3922935.1 hypothetical protein [Paenibacillus terricola]